MCYCGSGHDGVHAQAAAAETTIGQNACGSKPMSSMRSASSRTRKQVLVRRMRPLHRRVNAKCCGGRSHCTALRRKSTAVRASATRQRMRHRRSTVRCGGMLTCPRDRSAGPASQPRGRNRATARTAAVWPTGGDEWVPLFVRRPTAKRRHTPFEGARGLGFVRCAAGGAVRWVGQTCCCMVPSPPNTPTVRRPDENVMRWPSSRI